MSHHKEEDNGRQTDGKEETEGGKGEYRRKGDSEIKDEELGKKKCNLTEKKKQGNEHDETKENRNWILIR